MLLDEFDILQIIWSPLTFGAILSLVATTIQPTMANPYESAMAGIIACARQRKLNKPVDITTDYEATVPVARRVYKIQTANTDYTGSGRSPTIGVMTSRGHKIDFVWVSFWLPAQVARDLSDKFEYDSLPALNALQQVETTLGGSIQLETVNTIGIIQRLYNYFGHEQFKILANKHWGGFYDPITGERGPLQRLTGLSKTSLSTTDLAQNEIFPRMAVHVPMPVSLFFNRERFCFSLSMDTPLDVKFVFRDTTAFISRTAHTTPALLGDQMDVYHEWLQVVDQDLFFNNSSYFGNRYTNSPRTGPYYFLDEYFETFTKSYSTSNDLRLSLRPSMTKRLQLFVTDRQMETQLPFFGTTVMSAVANSLASQVWTNSTQLNAAYTINLNTGFFLSSGTAVSGSLSVVGWTIGGTKFDVVWQRTSTSVTTVTINTTSPLGSFGDLYFDLSTWSSNTNLNGFNNVLQGGMFFLCRSFTLDIRPFVHSPNDIDNFEIATLTHGEARKLARGYYSFNPDPNNPTINRHAFYRVRDIIPHHLLKNSGPPAKSGFAFDFLASRAVPSTHNAHPLVAREYIRLVKNQHFFFDLDCKWPIELEQLTFEKTGSNSELLQQNELMLARQWKSERPNRWAAPVDIDFSYVDHERNISSHGYNDYRIFDVISYVVKIANTKILYDEIEITDVLKEWAATELQFTSLQWSIRVLYAENDVLLSLREPALVGALNDNVLTNVLAKYEIHEFPAAPQRSYYTDERSALNRVVNSSRMPYKRASDSRDLDPRSKKQWVSGMM